MHVYFHRNPITYEIFYVGIGVRKWRAYDFKHGRNPFWRSYIIKYGTPIVQIVHYGLDKEHAHFWERHYIKLLGKKKDGGTLVNISDGGDSSPMLSKESQARSVAGLLKWLKENPDKNSMKRPEVRAKFIGENNSSKRPEVREKLRLANIGKKQSDETKLKNSLNRRGKPITHLIGYKHSKEVIERLKSINKEIVNRPEVKEKLSLANKGKRNIKNFIGVNMIDLNTNEVIKTFPCITDALNIFGKPKSGNISLVCNGKRNKAFGYKWEHIKDAHPKPLLPLNVQPY